MKIHLVNKENGKVVHRDEWEHKPKKGELISFDCKMWEVGHVQNTGDGAMVFVVDITKGSQG